MRAKLNTNKLQLKAICVHNSLQYVVSKIIRWIDDKAIPVWKSETPNAGQFTASAPKPRTIVLDQLSSRKCKPSLGIGSSSYSPNAVYPGGLKGTSS